MNPKKFTLSDSALADFRRHWPGYSFMERRAVHRFIEDQLRPMSSSGDLEKVEQVPFPITIQGQDVFAIVLRYKIISISSPDQTLAELKKRLS